MSWHVSALEVFSCSALYKFTFHITLHYMSSQLHVIPSTCSMFTAVHAHQTSPATFSLTGFIIINAC